MLKDNLVTLLGISLLIGIVIGGLGVWGLYRDQVRKAEEKADLTEDELKVALKGSILGKIWLSVGQEGGAFAIFCLPTRPTRYCQLHS